MGRKTILSILLYVSLWNTYAQLGCTDVQALNFNPLAQWNDGSCIYPPTNYSSLWIQDLPNVLIENSGLIFWNDFIWTINDGGSTPSIYKLDQNGVVLDTIHIASATNVDWEAMTQSNTKIYIGDFGNNAGNRTDLGIYEINKSDILAGNMNVTAQKRAFKYGDQLDFTVQTNGHSFDCESFYYDADSLVLISKAWNNFYAKRYRFESVWSDTLVIFPQDSLYMDGLITDVSYDTLSKRTLAIGYKNNGSNFYTSFVYLLFNHPDTHIFSGNKRRIELGNMLTLSQTEGITFKDSASGFFSSEQISSVITIPPKLFSFDFTSYFSDDIGLNDISLRNMTGISPNPCIQYITVPIGCLGQRVLIYSMTGQFCLQTVIDPSLTINVESLVPAPYYLYVDGKYFRFIKTE